ncbi:MAG: T9SS type A sorting domain-containing protein, partial [Candidatus Eisenbacteria bacterium]|nr:T9SS type A sorting domain-containing protein [Candidatus Eisenbacteria bacterium]
AMNAMTESPVSLLGQVSSTSSLGVGEEGSFVYSVSVDGEGETSTTLLTLTLGSDQGGWGLTQGLNVGGPMLELEGLLIEEISGDGDNIAEPFEEIAITPLISNKGPGTSRSLTGELLFVQSEGSTFTKATASYGPIASGETVPGSGFQPFTLQIGPGPELPIIELRLSDGLQERFSRFLDFVPPAVPTNIFLTGRTDAIEVRWTPPENDMDVMRYLVWAADAEEGPFEQVSGFGTEPNAYYVEQNLPPLSRRFYQLAAQDSSGNTSARSPIARGTTTLPLIAGFPAESGLGTTTSPLAIDADHDGRMDIFTGGEALYAFHGDGSELRDGDLDARTLGVWALVNPVDAEDGVWAAPAAGDLDGDGRIEIVAATRKKGSLFVWDENGVLRPGWPKPTTAIVGGAATLVGGPVLTDLTGDGNLEIVIHSDRAVYAYTHDGTEVVDGDNDSQTEGVFFRTGSGASYASVAAADFDEDDKSELVVCTRAGRLYLLEDDGTVMDGYPIQYGGDLVSSPAIADLDGNGSLEIIFATGADSVEVINVDGTRRPGWPQYVLMNQDFFSSPAVADWDNNGSLEVAIVSGNNRVHLFTADGAEFEGFSVRFFDAFGSPVAVKSSGAIGNVDADPDLEYVFGDQSGQIFALNLDGTLAEGFPIQMGSGIEGGLMVFDVNGDGVNEIALTALDSKTYLYQTAGAVGSNLGWPMFHHDPRRTGLYTTPIIVETAPNLSIGVLQSAQVPDQATIYVVSTHLLTAVPDVTLDSASLTVSEIGEKTRAYRARVDLSPGSHTVEVTGTSVSGTVGMANRTFNAAAAPTTEGWSPLGNTQIYAEEFTGWPTLLLTQSAENNPYAPASGAGAIQVGPAGWDTPRGTRVRLPIDANWSAGRVLAWSDGAWNQVEAWPGSDGTAEFAPEQFGWFKVVPSDTWSLRPMQVQALSPNPFAQKTRIAFTLTRSQEVQVDVFDVRGAKVRAIAGRSFDAGHYELFWDRETDLGRSVAEGIYFVRVKGEDGPASVQKVVVLNEGGAR